MKKNEMETTQTCKGSVVSGTGILGHPSGLEAQEVEAMSLWVSTELRSISCLLRNNEANVFSGRPSLSLGLQ